MGELKRIAEARSRRQLVQDARRAECRQRIVRIEWDPISEWHSAGRSGVGVWVIYKGDSTIPYARQLTVKEALRYAGDVMRATGF